MCFLFPDVTLTNKEFHMFYFANLEELIKNSRNKLLSKSTYILKIPGGNLWTEQECFWEQLELPQENCEHPESLRSDSPSAQWGFRCMLAYWARSEDEMYQLGLFYHYAVPLSFLKTTWKFFSMSSNNRCWFSLSMFSSQIILMKCCDLLWKSKSVLKGLFSTLLFSFCQQALTVVSGWVQQYHTVHAQIAMSRGKTKREKFSWVLL